MEISLLQLEGNQKDSNKFLSHHIRILKKLFIEITDLNLEVEESNYSPLWFEKIIIINFLLINFLGLKFLSEKCEEPFEDWKEVYIKYANPIKLVVHLEKHLIVSPDSQSIITFYQENEEELSRNLERIDWIKYSEFLNDGYIWISNYDLEEISQPNLITFELFDKLAFLNDEKKVTKEIIRRGRVYTPYNLAAEIVNRAINQLLMNNDFFLKFQHDLPQIRILDPSVGTGVFLIATGNVMIEKVSAHHKKINNTRLREHIIKNNLFGIDIDPLGIIITKIKLFLWVVEGGSNINQGDNFFSNFQVGNTLFGINDTSILSFRNKNDRGGLSRKFDEVFSEQIGVYQIHVEKSLEEKIQLINEIKNEIVEQKGFRYFILEATQEEWNLHNSKLNPDIKKKVHFSKLDSYNDSESCYAIFKKGTTELENTLPIYMKPYHFESAFHWTDLQFTNKFDLVIGNPPFIALTDLSILSRLKLNIFYPEIYNGNSDLASFFLFRMLDFIYPNGILGFILPKYIMTSVHSTKIRKVILKNFGILEIHDFDERAIFGTYGVKTIFVLLKRTKTTKKHIFDFFKYNKKMMNMTKTHSLPQSILTDRKWIILPSHLQEIIDHLNKQSEYRLEDIAVLSKGIETGCDEVFAPSEPYFFSKKLDLDAKYIHPWLKGREIKKFGISREGREVLYAPKSQEDKIRTNTVISNYLKKNKAKLMDRSRIFKYYLWRVGDERYTIDWKARKLVSPYKAKNNTFAIDNEGCLSSKDVVWIIPKENFQNTDILHFLVGILNSKLLNFFSRYWLKDLGGVFDYYPQQIKDIPIIIPPLTSREFNRVVKSSIYLQNKPLESKTEEVIEELNNTVFSIYKLTKVQISYLEADLANQIE